MELSINSIVSLNTGDPMPVIGLGLFKIPDGEMAVEAVGSAFEAGYRMIDTASVYENEASVGQAIHASEIGRGEVFLTTKLWNEDQGYKEARKALEASLKRLGTDYVDLYLVHWPVAGKRLDSWRALEDMVDEGLCKAIGVSNYMKRHLVELLMHCRIKPAVNQIELSPFNFKYREDVVRFCRKNDIQVAAYSPLTKGLKLNDPRLFKIAQRYYKSPAQVLIRWALQEGFMAIPKAQGKEHIYENINVFDFTISDDDMMLLSELNENLVTGWDPSDMP